MRAAANEHDDDNAATEDKNPAPAAPVHDVATATSDAMKNDIIIPQDLGHRYGNFHNYYSFHPPSNRLEVLKETGILDHIAKTCSNKRRRLSNDNNDDDGKHSVDCHTFTYADVGCNEGDMTMELARALHDALRTPIEFVGIDIDSTLVSRANQKWSNEGKNITGNFAVANVCNSTEFSCILEKKVDLISVLSTTMWIHVHAGDEGLRKALQLICSKTRRYILMEPQPPTCYRNAAVRLRKMGRRELDVSAERLQLRPKIEQEIELILNQQGFRRVELMVGDSKQRTKWNRALQLYERV